MRRGLLGSRRQAVEAIAAGRVRVGGSPAPAPTRLVAPDEYVVSLEHGARLMDAAVNVRVFKVADGRPGEHVMDTRGLTAFGLPDLQIHFHTLAVPRVAELLFAYAEYTFDKGDVLTNDSVVRGVESTDEWECRRAKSLVAPHRDVIDILPGEWSVAH